MIILRKIYNKLLNLIKKYYSLIYESKLRRKLKNKNFSIVCSNCIGGIIYHRLGHQFLSPTINLWMHQDDFIKFVLNLKEYISKDVEFIESEYDYPVGVLGDIKIYFNHSKTQEEARASWYNRKSRINYDNLFIIMYDRDGITKEDIKKLEQVDCRNKIVLSDKVYPDIDYVLTIKPNYDKINGQQYLDKDILDRMTFEKYFDFVKFINCKN
ncbi:DUF1919 domain-containing protein [Intestinibacter bartlettii]|uniref:DUF1919 domain-containing protein n=1 Tax=Intestinibacter bartlettii TaxID=261299 RepID=UPI00248C84BC|nr:DUF1919 domain-containing protein [Intestinibacter bartlettii]